MTQYYRGYEVISNKNSGTKSTEFSGVYRGIRHVGVANDDKPKATGIPVLSEGIRFSVK